MFHNPEEQATQLFGGDNSYESKHNKIEQRLVTSLAALQGHTHDNSIAGFGICNNGLCLPPDHPLHLSWKDTVLPAQQKAGAPFSARSSAPYSVHDMVPSGAFTSAPSSVPPKSPSSAPTKDPPTTDVVLGFELFNAGTNKKIADLNEGDIVNLDDFGLSGFNIVAVVSGTSIGSLNFGVDNDDSFRLENGAPYALCGDDGGNFASCPASVFNSGTHTLTGTAYENGNKAGTTIAMTSVSFTIVPSLCVIPEVSIKANIMTDKRIICSRYPRIFNKLLFSVCRRLGGISCLPTPHSRVSWWIHRKRLFGSVGILGWFR
jgi:hypothetical protein